MTRITFLAQRPAGASNNGAAFSLGFSSGKWTETLLYNFGGGVFGDSSWASLTPDGNGGFFGTTQLEALAAQEPCFGFCRDG